jgi:hypothetical protein
MTKQQKIKLTRRKLRGLQKTLPTALPVTISAKKTDSFWGETRLVKNKTAAAILINWDHDWEVISSWILPHEYAHVRVWGRLQAGNLDHDGHFWLETGIVTKASDLYDSYED